MELDKEILDGFLEESNQILGELHEVLEKMEDQDGFPKAELEDFAQKIDRIMGAAKTLGMGAPDHEGLKRIAKLSELSKFIGYKTAEKGEIGAVPILASFWEDTLEVMDQLLKTIEDEEENKKVAKAFSQTLQKRLEWFMSSVLKKEDQAPKPEADKKADVENLLKNMGF